ncbi:hypothetical protein [Nocardia cyriacigeorgica]|uniref:hypothetical protein n=1 Tax=Nocardia cyriacigeorgica TaxID=135487 RepID=UPI002455342E|nr:hypothetical protein [Nocardia cyriacigeorgica]
MGADKVKADPDDFQRAAEKTGAVRDKVQGILNTLQASISSYGTPWGNDKLGSSFTDGEQGYFAARESLTGNIENVANSFNNFRSGQAQTVVALRKMERANEGSFE